MMVTLQAEVFAAISIFWWSVSDPPPFPKPTTSAWWFHHYHNRDNTLSTWCFGVHNLLVSMGGHCGREETMSLTLSLLLNWRKRSLLTRKMVTTARTVVRPTIPSRTKKHFLPKKIFLGTFYKLDRTWEYMALIAQLLIRSNAAFPLFTQLFIIVSQQSVVLVSMVSLVLLLC